MLKETVSSVQGGRPCVLIEVEGGALLGYKRAQLLENIAMLSSISEAANAVPISYVHALELVDLMNGYSSAPLVETLNTGSHVGQAKLTPEGRNALLSFWALYEQFKISISTKLSELSQQKNSADCMFK